MVVVIPCKIEGLSIARGWLNNEVLPIAFIISAL